MKRRGLVKAGKYNSVHGTYYPIHKEKYIGESNPKFKSRLEQKLMAFCDKNTLVIDWSYERIVIPYKDKTRLSNNKPTTHKYYMDFKIKMKTKTGNKIFLVEVKSKKETIQPKNSKRKKPENYKKEVETWIRNKCKWEAATKSAHARGWEFKILTEDNLK